MLISLRIWADWSASLQLSNNKIGLCLDVNLTTALKIYANWPCQKQPVQALKIHANWPCQKQPVQALKIYANWPCQKQPVQALKIYANWPCQKQPVQACSIAIIIKHVLSGFTDTTPIRSVHNQHYTNAHSDLNPTLSENAKNGPQLRSDFKAHALENGLHGCVRMYIFELLQRTCWLTHRLITTIIFRQISYHFKIGRTIV